MRPPQPWTPAGWPGWSPPAQDPGGRTSSPPRSWRSVKRSWRPTRGCGQQTWPTRSPTGSGCGSIPARWSGLLPAAGRPKAQAADAARPDADRSLIDCYEQLRRYALGGHADGHRLGLAVLLRYGVAAWIHARAELPAAPPPPAAAPPTG